MAGEPHRTKVLHVINSNGRNRYLESIARHIDPTKYQLFVAGIDRRGPLNDALAEMGVESFHFQPGGPRSPQNVLALARLLRRLRPEVVHSHTFWVSVVTTALARLLGVPKVFVTRHHAAIHLNLGKRGHIGLERLMTRMTTRTVAVSDYVRDIMVHREGHPADKVVRVHNAIDPLPVRPGFDRPALIAQQGLAAADLLGITIGRIHPEKNLEVLVAAAERLPPDNNIRFLLVGPAEPHYQRQLTDRLAARGLSDRFRFLGLREDVGDLLANVDFLVHPSRDESFGFVTLEALSMGVPVICSDIPAAREVVTGELAAFFPADSAEQLAARIQELATHLPEHRARALLGKQRAQECFSFPHLMRQYEELYERAD
jgi:glycosyltransferase involved in cell wall biosynthesis